MEKIISRRSGICVHTKKLGKDRSYRTQCGEFICDGTKLLGEAVKSGIDIISVFTSSQLEMTLTEQIDIYKVPKDILDTMSPLKNPRDVLFICKIPEQTCIDYSKGTHILLDNVQDPGNVGTIIRSADAFGIDSVILFGDCADLYNPKTIRASMGAIFRQKTAMVDTGQLKDIKGRFVGTAKNSDFTPADKANFKDSIIILGNEGQGISAELCALCEEMTAIPVSSGCESLNVAVAASILMWEASKTKEGGILCQ